MEALSGLLFLLTLGFAITTLIKRIKKKDYITFRRITLGCLAGFFITFIIAYAADDLTTLLGLLGIVFFAVAVITVLINLIRMLIKRTKPRMWLSSVICGGLCVLSITVFFISLSVGFSPKNASHEDYEITIKTEYDFEVKDGDTPLEIEKDRGFGSNSSFRLVYDKDSLPLMLDDVNVTAAQCLAAIRNNNELSPEFKERFSDFVRRIDEKHPDADLSPLYCNLKTLKLIELDQMSYLIKSLSLDSYGCYLKPENAIYIPEGTEYIEGEWGFQVLIHEFCHAARTVWRESDGQNERIQFCSETDNTLLEECMNSVFSCSLLNYEEKDIAYQVPSNYLRIMLECMDNYELSDYLNHSDLYFLSKLDDFTGHTNYAQVMWKLITLQRSDWEDDKTDIPAEEYYPIYDYLCKMYYDKYITADMTEDEMNAVAAELVEKAFFDAPEGYKTDPQYFYDFLKEYAAA